MKKTIICVGIMAFGLFLAGAPQSSGDRMSAEDKIKLKEQERKWDTRDRLREKEKAKQESLVELRRQRRKEKQREKRQYNGPRSRVKELEARVESLEASVAKIAKLESRIALLEARFNIAPKKTHQVIAPKTPPIKSVR